MRVLGVWSDHLPRHMHCETAVAYCSGGVSTKLPCSLIKIVSALAGEPLHMGFCQGLAGPWCARREREAVKANVQWFNGSMT